MASSGDPDQKAKIERAFARCFGGAEGELALAHLRSLTLDRAMGPNSTDASFRHLDGQRCLVLHIQALIDRGRGIS
ncbi:MAG: hypothetical protein P1V34_18370 [Alphaproteobacteria bacterium]|nr:hypothetical protein [Alphaproteobacteria bacterium]